MSTFLVMMSTKFKSDSFSSLGKIRKLSLLFSSPHPIYTTTQNYSLIFYCLGPVNMLLSWKGFIPLSRLTYGLYLLHPFAIWWFVASGDGLITFTIPIFILLFLGM